MKEEDNDKVPVIDLSFDGKQKDKENRVHSSLLKDSHLNHYHEKIKTQREHKSGVIKGYTERAKALSDPQYLKEELEKSLKKMDTAKKKLEKQCKQETKLHEKKRKLWEWQ